MWTADNAWTPIAATALLDTPAMKAALKGLSNPWKYDKTKFRIFRWFGTSVNKDSAQKWVEFPDTAEPQWSAQFNLTPGNLIWVKTKVSTMLELGRATTLPLDSNRILKLAPKDWTDFELPFRFPVAIGDILNATQSSTPGLPDSLEFYSWKKNAAGQYVSDLMFMTAIVDTSLNNIASPVLPQSGYTVFNPLPDTVFLAIPPLPNSMSSLAKKHLKKKTAAEDGWAVKLVTKLSDSTELSPVYCGFSKSAAGGVSYYPCSPSFSDAYAGVFNLTVRKTFGNALAHSTSEGGCAYLLVFDNGNSNDRKFLYHVENQGALPAGFEARIFNSTTEKFEDTLKGVITMNLGGNSKDYRWLLVGTKSYLAKAAMIASPGILRLLDPYPNPFRSVIHIRYTLPFDGVDNVRFFVYNLAGRVVWQQEVKNQGFGNMELTWNARTGSQMLASGIYIIRMTAFDLNRKLIGNFEKKMMFLP
jgi:hypothetical protein